jgi:hypothetical protein
MLYIKYIYKYKYKMRMKHAHTNLKINKNFQKYTSLKTKRMFENKFQSRSLTSNRFVQFIK